MQCVILRTHELILVFCGSNVDKLVDKLRSEEVSFFKVKYKDLNTKNSNPGQYHEFFRNLPRDGYTAEPYVCIPTLLKRLRTLYRIIVNVQL